MSLQQLESNAVKIKRKVKRCITWLSKLSCHGENRKQPTFYDATSGSPAKWSLRNESRNSILMMHHYPDLVRASDCLKKISNAARSVESIAWACIADVKVVAWGGWECKKEKKGMPATKAASFALRPSFQLSQLSLQRPIRIRRTLFCMNDLTRECIAKSGFVAVKLEKIFATEWRHRDSHKNL